MEVKDKRHAIHTSHNWTASFLNLSYHKTNNTATNWASERHGKTYDDEPDNRLPNKLPCKLNRYCDYHEYFYSNNAILYLTYCKTGRQSQCSRAAKHSKWIFSLENPWQELKVRVIFKASFIHKIFNLKCLCCKFWIKLCVFGLRIWVYYITVLVAFVKFSSAVSADMNHF